VFGRVPFVVALIGLLGAPSLIAETSRSPRNANYTINARLDHATHTIHGDERISWRNISSRAATSLQFHLYFNAWRDERSTWMREAELAGLAETARRDRSDWASIVIDKLEILSSSGEPGVDVTTQLRFIAPDDGNADDRTVAELPLSRVVGPGDTIQLKVQWTSRVPRTFARTGVVGDYYFIGQWFPKLGVLEDTGWNCHQFHASTEFFSDFGVYDVHLTVPRDWIVGATGVEQDVADGTDGSRTHHFYQEDVHDFAWTTSPHYLERRERFEHPSLPPVDIRLLLQPEHEDQAARHFAGARASLKYFGEWFGPYPYGHLTVIDPAWQSGTDGMEYPTLITGGTEWRAPRGVTDPEDVVVHETGHQFWYGIVATNEFENAWMDEGLTTFSSARTVEAASFPNFYAHRYFGSFIPWTFRELPLSREIDGDRMAGYRKWARQDVESTPSFRYWPVTGGAISYNKTAVWLHTLERHLGWTVLQRILSTYFHRYAFKHPKPADFFAIVNEVSGQDLSWYVDQVYRGSQTFDYGVDAIRSDNTGPDGNRTIVVVRRYGDGIFPVTVRASFEDGQQVDWQWDGRDRWKMFEVTRRSRALTAEVDPGRVLLLDVNRTNNSASLRPRADVAARKWSLAWLVWLQDQLLTYGFFV
jgi:peptidase M1-like protein